MAALADLLSAADRQRLADRVRELATQPKTASAIPEVCRECGRPLREIEVSIPAEIEVFTSHEIENSIVPAVRFVPPPEVDEEAGQ